MKHNFGIEVSGEKIPGLPGVQRLSLQRRFIRYHLPVDYDGGQALALASMENRGRSSK